MKVISTALLLSSNLVTSSLAQGVTFQDASNTMLRVDNGTYGPPFEEVQ